MNSLEQPFTDDFDQENGGKDQFDYSGFANWDVVGGNVDLIGVEYDFLDRDGMYVDTAGSSGGPGELVSKEAFSLEPGQYELKFDLAGSQRNDTTNSVRVALGSAFGEEFTLNSDESATTIVRQIDITEATEAKLSFQQTNPGGDYFGLLLDNVSLSRK